MRLVFHVQHLLGIGHLRRAASLAAGLARHGFAVTVASGGFPVDGIGFGSARVVQLPPVRAGDPAFSTHVTTGGRPIDADWEARRLASLRSILDDVDPDAVLIESYPFGRRRFRFEYDLIFEWRKSRRPPALLATSVRDVLVTKPNPERHRETVDRILHHVDRVLVHGDPALIRFEETFPLTDRISDRLIYTGYVTDSETPVTDGVGDGDGNGEVIVSAGGGAVGAALLHTALAARPLSAAAGLTWRILCGPDLAAEHVAALRSGADPGVLVEANRPDFPALLRRCAASISQAGYNTVLDLLAAGCPAVLVPFSTGQETEQAVRAQRLAERGAVTVVTEANLTPDHLARAIDAARAAGRPIVPPIRRDGAAATATILATALTGRAGQKSGAAGNT